MVGAASLCRVEGERRVLLWYKFGGGSNADLNKLISFSCCVTQAGIPQPPTVENYQLPARRGSLSNPYATRRRSPAPKSGPRPASRDCCGSRSVRPARRRAGDGTWPRKRPRLPGPAWLLERHRSDAPTASGQPVHLHWLSLSAKLPFPFPASLFSLPGSPSLHVALAIVPAISWTAAACPVDGHPCSRAGLGAGTALAPAGSAAACSNPPSRLPFARSWDSCQPMVRVQRRGLKGLMDGVGFTGTDGWRESCSPVPAECFLRMRSPGKYNSSSSRVHAVSGTSRHQVQPVYQPRSEGSGAGRAMEQEPGVQPKAPRLFFPGGFSTL